MESRKKEAIQWLVSFNNPNEAFRSFYLGRLGDCEKNIDYETSLLCYMGAFTDLNRCMTHYYGGHLEKLPYLLKNYGELFCFNYLNLCRTVLCDKAVLDKFLSTEGLPLLHSLLDFYLPTLMLLERFLHLEYIKIKIEAAHNNNAKVVLQLANTCINLMYQAIVLCQEINKTILKTEEEIIPALCHLYRVNNITSTINVNYILFHAKHHQAIRNAISVDNSSTIGAAPAPTSNVTSTTRNAIRISPLKQGDSSAFSAPNKCSQIVSVRPGLFRVSSLLTDDNPPSPPNLSANNQRR